MRANKTVHMSAVAYACLRMYDDRHKPTPAKISPIQFRLKASAVKLFQAMEPDGASKTVDIS
jgi:hypothetical protein